MKRVVTITTSILACYGAYCAVNLFFGGREVPPALILLLIIGFCIYLLYTDWLALATGLCVMVAYGITQDGMGFRGFFAIGCLVLLIFGLNLAVNVNRTKK